MITLQHCRTGIAIAAMFAASGGFAATGDKTDYKAAKDRISAEYKADKAACDKFNGNQKDICVEQAKGKEKVALAEAEYNYTGKAATPTRWWSRRPTRATQWRRKCATTRAAMPRKSA